MHELPLLINIAVALVAAFIGGAIARAVRLPTLVGYMVAHHVIQPELEGGLQVVRRTLLELGYSLRKVQQYTDAVRSDRYNTAINTDEERQFLNELLMASDNIGLSWLPLGDENKLVGKTLVDSKLRETTGASIVAISRGGKMIANPTPQTVLMKGDVIGMIGEDEQLEKARRLLSDTDLPDKAKI